MNALLAAEGGERGAKVSAREARRGRGNEGQNALLKQELRYMKELMEKNQAEMAENQKEMKRREALMADDQRAMKQLMAENQEEMKRREEEMLRNQEEIRKLLAGYGGGRGA